MRFRKKKSNITVGKTYNFCSVIMSEFVLIVIVSILVMCIFIHYETALSELVYVESTIDNNMYLVRNRPDRIEAANLFARLRKRLDDFVSRLVEDVPTDMRVKRLQTKFNSSNIRESLSSSRHTSYSINKGEKIVFCIRNKNKNSEIIDFNTVVFVAIHELAHVATLEVGHTPVFWSNMKFLLEKAVEYGLYQKQDFQSNPEPYCGIMITDSPLSSSPKT